MRSNSNHRPIHLKLLLLLVNASTSDYSPRAAAYALKNLCGTDCLLGRLDHICCLHALHSST